MSEVDVTHIALVHLFRAFMHLCSRITGVGMLHLVMSLMYFASALEKRG